MGTALSVLFAVAFGIGIVWVGLGFLRAFSSPLPEPPPPGELRKVKIVYRCRVCGAEVRMTMAPSEDPDPPRHCMDEMILVAPIE